MGGVRECIGDQDKIDGQARDAKAKVVERIDVLEASLDVVTSTTKERGGCLAYCVRQVVRSRGFETRGHVEVAEADNVVVGA